jgi:hypothetical protein
VSKDKELTYAIDFGGGRQSRGNRIVASRWQPRAGEAAGRSIARIARLMALAIRFEGLLREEKIEDYAELARLGQVTRARMTQIMKLLLLAPDIQEQILFLPPGAGLNERNLRPVAGRIDWHEQRRLFQVVLSLRQNQGSAGGRNNLLVARHPIH